MIIKELKIFKQLVEGEDLIVIDIETKGNTYYLGNTELLGVGFYFPSKDISCYVPNKVYENGSLHYVNLDDGLRDYIVEVVKTKKLICHNSNFDLGYFSYGLKQDILPYWDTRIAWHIINPELYKESRKYSLEYAIKYILQKDSHKQDMYNYLKSIGAKASGEDIYCASLDKIAQYCEDDCRTTYELYEYQRPIIEKFNAYTFMEGVFKYQVLLWKQQWEGIKFDTDKALKYLKTLNRASNICATSLKTMCAPEIKKIEKHLTLKKADSYKRESTRDALLLDENRWIKFNFRSRVHIGMLMEELGLENLATTEEGNIITSQDELVKYSSNPAINIIIKYFELQTKKKFVEQYLEVVVNGRYHPDMDICGTASGRLSAFAPNILAINRRDRRFMECFVADDGYVFVASDYANVEPRIEAHFAQDDELADIVINNKDIYLELLKYIYPDKVNLYDPNNLEKSKKVLKKERDMLKEIRLALGYGMQIPRLAKSLEIDTSEARRIYNAYWTARKCTKNLENRLLIQYKNKGHIKNMWGRPLTLAFTKDILNRYIQSSAHDTLVVSNLEIIPMLSALGIEYKLTLIDIHDEFILSIKKDKVNDYTTLIFNVIKNLNETLKLKVPLSVSYKVVNNFSELDK